MTAYLSNQPSKKRAFYSTPLYLLLAIFITGCSVEPNENLSPRILVHQGGYGQWPSNTLLAFEQAEKLGQVDEFELDIHLTSDGQLVVMHDETVDRTTNGSGFIRDMTLAEIQSLDAGYNWFEDEPSGEFPFRNKGVTVPTLQSLFERFPAQAMTIEIKPTSPSMAAQLCQMLHTYYMADHVTVGSFDHNVIADFRHTCPDVETGASSREANIYVIASKMGLGSFFKPNAQVLQLPPSSGPIDVLSPRFIRQAHSDGFQVYAWTINETDEMKALMAMGIDGIITDYPSRLIELMGSARE
ncbi:MAG: glycerophosphodiester phosphodiesterase [Pseudomonadales bacterium]